MKYGRALWLLVAAFLAYHLIHNTVTALKILGGFGLLIGVHELGHALAAALIGVKVHKFSLGIGPGIRFRVPILNELILSPFLIGGYVTIDEEALAAKSFWGKFFVAINGMVANVLTCIFLLMTIGFSAINALLISLKIWLWGWPLTIAAFSNGQATANDMAGPIGIGQMIANGTFDYILLVACLNAAIAMFNLLPLPPLDGGRILMHLLEKMLGAKIAERVNEFLISLGTILLIILIIWVTTNDLCKL